MPTIISSSRGLVVPVAAAARPIAQSHHAPGCRSLDSRGPLTVPRSSVATRPCHRLRPPARGQPGPAPTPAGRSAPPPAQRRCPLFGTRDIRRGLIRGVGRSRLRAELLAEAEALASTSPWPWPAATPCALRLGGPCLRARAGSRLRLGGLVGRRLRRPPWHWSTPSPVRLLVAFLVGALVAVLVGRLRGAGAGLLFTGAAPGGSALPPFCQENARKPPFGTLVPPTPEDGVGPLAGLAVGPVEAPVGIGRWRRSRTGRSVGRAVTRQTNPGSRCA